MPPDLKERVKKAADTNNRSMNAEIVSALEEKYPKPREELDLPKLSTWLDYIFAGGSEYEIDDRLAELNGFLAKNPECKSMRVAKLTDNGDDIPRSGLRIVLETRIDDEH